MITLVTLLLFADPETLGGDARVNYEIVKAAGTRMELWLSHIDPEALSSRQSRADWIVDALLGTGTQGEIREPFGTIIHAINAATAKVLAVDLPSGMDCDTGESLGVCVQADVTANDG